jgi:hypothetical protein
MIRTDHGGELTLEWMSLSLKSRFSTEEIAAVTELMMPRFSLVKKYVDLSQKQKLANGSVLVAELKVDS